MDRLLFGAVYAVSCVLRWIFLSSKTGSIVSNFILYFMAKLLFCRRSDSIDVIDISVIVRQSCRGNFATTELQRRFLNLAPNTRKRMIRFVAMNLTGRRKRGKLLKQGLAVPRNIFISPTYRCNLDCQGCYAKGRLGELPLEIIDRIVKEQEKLGICNIFFIGGEPLLREDLWEIYERYPDTLFTVFTNGTMVGEKEIAEIARLGNVRLLISLDGFQEKTDKRRGIGVYEKAIGALDACKQTNILYGVSVMISRDNYDEVTGGKFVEEMVRRGAYFLIFTLYMPFGQDCDMSLVITRDQLEALEKRVADIKNHYPIFPVVGKNGSNKVTACSAANQRMHIAADGSVEPCFFCEWAVDTISGKSLLDVLNSPFFQLVRDLNSTGETAFNSCKTYQSLFLQKTFEMAGAQQTCFSDAKEV